MLTIALLSPLINPMTLSSGSWSVMETGPGPTPLIITLPQLMACKVQLIDTSDTFLDNSSSYLGAMPYLAQMMGIATPSSGRQIDILVGKWYKINAPLTSWWWGASVTTVWVGNIILMFTCQLVVLEIHSDDNNKHEHFLLRSLH